MPNILINPNSGLMEFTTGTAGGSTFNTNFTGGAFVSRLGYDNFGSLNLTSYVSNITGLDRFTVDGANGRLFSVTDNLSGSLFSVNDIAGLPIIEAFDDNTVIMGAFNRNDFVLTGNALGLGGLPNTGTTKLYVSGNMLLSGTLTTNQRPFVNGTGVLLSGEAAQVDLSTTVRTTGNQTISGKKTFAEDTTFGDPGQGDFLVISGNSFTVYGSGNFTSGLFVNGTGVLLSGQATQVDLGSTVRTTGNQTVSGVKDFQSAPLVSGKEVYYQKNIVYFSGISFTPDYISGRNFIYSLTGFATTYNTINNPINIPEGETIIIKVIQSNYGNNFLNFGNNYRFPADASPLITQGSGKFDIFNILKLDNRFITTYIKNFSN